MLINLFFIIIGFSLLIKGADILVNGASSIAKRFNIPEIIIGLTIVAVGTSLPELMVSLVSAVNNHADMAIGNVIGSNISNVFFIMGISAVIKPLKFSDETIRLEIPLVIFLTALLYILGNNGMEKIITQSEGLLLIIFCILFILYNIWMAIKKSKESIFEVEEKENNNLNIIKSIIKIIIGVVFLKFGGDFVVDNVSEIASILGVSEKMISLTVVSFSTSLPELITSITATIKDKADIGVGNILGSNIFNIVLIIGVTAFIRPIEYSMSYNKDIIIFMIGMIVLEVIPFIGEKNKITRWCGLSYVFSYFSYMFSLLYINLI